LLLFDAVAALYATAAGRATGLDGLLTHKLPRAIPRLHSRQPMRALRPDFQLRRAAGGALSAGPATELETCPSAQGFAHAMQAAYALPTDLAAAVAQLLDGRTLLIAATIFANFVNVTSMPMQLKDTITHLGLSPIMVVAAMMVIYVILGTVMEELTMVLLTIPLFFPIVVQLGFDPVWFGVLIVMVIQIGLISPPVGMNLFVINTLLPKVGLGAIFRGVWPYVMVMVLTLGILLAFPQISLWLPSFMK
jgi:TRAP-type mannitol/chloroaromatic compound transport system permease large subunit